MVENSESEPNKKDLEGITEEELEIRLNKKILGEEISVQEMEELYLLNIDIYSSKYNKAIKLYNSFLRDKSTYRLECYKNGDGQITYFKIPKKPMGFVDNEKNK